MIPTDNLILNPDGSIYHLNVCPDEVAPTIILVGDPERVPTVSQYFDRIDIKKQRREFAVHTGRLGKLPLSVVSTGIGVGNIDIVFNELDALFNIDFATRTPKEKFTQLRFLRLGTCGGLQPEINVDSVVISDYAVGFDNLLSYYEREISAAEASLLEEVQQGFAELQSVASGYAIEGASAWLDVFKKFPAAHGITLTCLGFYGPQGRRVRAQLKGVDILDLAQHFRHKDLAMLNFEMETAAIYGMGRVLGHQCCSISTILANRAIHKFSPDPHGAIVRMIVSALEQLSASA